MKMIGVKMMNRPSKDKYYLDIALAVSKRSTCLHRHYGCVIVKDDRIVSTGYNGSPRGHINCCDIGECKRAEFAAEKNHQGYELCDAVHAEQNAITAASIQDLKGATLYLVCEESIPVPTCNGEESDGQPYCWVEDKYPIPCNICRNMIINAEIETVISRGGIVCL